MTTLAAIRTTPGLNLLRAAVARSGFDHPEVLITWSDAAIPELAGRPGAPNDEFEQVIDLNLLLAPFHPAQWAPGEVELSLLGGILAHWTAGVSTVVVEDLDHPVCRALVRLIPDAAIVVLQPGLEAYGPPTARRDAGLESRVSAHWHLAYLPQLRPAVAGLARGVPVEPTTGRPGDWALVVGADQSARGGLSAAEETALLVGAIRLASAESDAIRVALAPSMAPAQVAQARWQCRDLAARVEWGPADRARRWGTPGVAIGFDAPELLSVQHAGARVQIMGLHQRLAALSPFQHQLRLPWMLLDSQLRADLPPVGDAVAQDLLDVVSYVLRPEWRPERAEHAAAALARLPQVERERYLWQRRLERLGLVAPRPPLRRWWERLRHARGRVGAFGRAALE